MSVFKVEPAQAIEAFLLKEEIFEKPSPKRREMLRCVGCYLLRSSVGENEQPRFFASQIEECTGIAHGAIYPFLGALAEGDIVVSQKEQRNVESFGRNLRIYYTLSLSEVGQVFRELLVVPDICPIQMFVAREPKIL